MALTNSGQISMNEMHIEAGGTSGTQVSMNDSDMRSLAGIASGQIAANNFYGKSASIDVDISITVGVQPNSYPYRGLAIAAFPNASTWGSGPSDFGTKGAYLPDVSLEGINYQGFPATGTPALRIHYKDTDAAPGDIDNLYVNITDGTNTTGDFPVGLNGETAYGQTFSARGNIDSMTVADAYIFDPNTYSNTLTDSDLLSIFMVDITSGNYQPEWNGVSLASGTSWTVNFFEN